MRLPNDHPLFQYQAKVNLICKPLFDSFSLNEFTYTKVFKNANFIHLDTHPEYMKYYYEFGIYPSLLELESNTRPYVIISPKIDQPYLSYASDKFKKNIALGVEYGVHHRLYLIKRRPEFFEIIGFGVNDENIHMIDYLIMHIETFNKFALFFKNELYTELNKSTQIKLELEGFYSTAYNKEKNIDEKINQFSEQIFLKNYRINDQKLSFREVQCLHYLAHGLTVKGISKCIQLAPKTVESHLYNLKNKLNCHSKSDLVKIFYTSDLADIETMI